MAYSTNFYCDACGVRRESDKSVENNHRIPSGWTIVYVRTANAPDPNINKRQIAMVCEKDQCIMGICKRLFIPVRYQCLEFITYGPNVQTVQW